ncbi:MAG: flavin reductase family protein [Candidatus Thermoplasmatota archaeon]|nr:flavin reductase family protein [Candidatus Thermoplasmatota archaeon]
MVVDGDTFRALMRQFPAGVTIVTFDDDGMLGGLTVSSFCSLSMEPPLVLVCIDNGVASHDAIARAGTFGVSICTVDQGQLAWDLPTLSRTSRRYSKRRHTRSQMVLRRCSTTVSRL